MPPAPRWGSLDVLRGAALCMMIVHHLLRWTNGREEQYLPGFDGFLLTDLAAPAFAVGVGAAAFLVGRVIEHRPRRALRTARRWGEVLLLGLAIDVAVGGGIDGGGVLPTLAVLGVTVTALSVRPLRGPLGWWAVSGLCVVAALPAANGGGDGFVAELWSGPFSVVVYGVFAAAGAAVAAHADGGGERALPLLPVAALTLVVAAVAARTAPAAVAPDGLWPPSRHPGDLAFTSWGLAGTLVLWAALRRVAPTSTLVGRGFARAGRRTLLVFGTHYLVKVALDRTGHLGTLDTTAWVVATAVVAVAACLLACAPRPRVLDRTSTHA